MTSIRDKTNSGISHISDTSRFANETKVSFKIMIFLNNSFRNDLNKREFLMKIINKILKCQCQLIAESYYLIDRIFDNLAKQEAKHKIELWILNNSTLFCFKTKYIDLETVKTSLELEQEQEQFMSILYKELLKIIDRLNISLNDLVEIRNNWSDEDDKKISIIAKKLYLEKTKKSQPIIDRDLEQNQQIDQISVLTNLSEQPEEISNEIQEDLYKTTFKDFQNVMAGRRIIHEMPTEPLPVGQRSIRVSARDVKSLKNLSKHMFYQPTSIDEIPKKEENFIISLCADPLIHLENSQNISAITNMWKSITFYYRQKDQRVKNMRNKIYYIAYVIKLLFPEKSYSSLAIAIRNIEGINAKPDILYNIDSNTVNINIYNHFNNYFSDQGQEDQDNIYRIRNDNNFMASFNKDKIISLVNSNAFETTNTTIITEHIINRRTQAILRIQQDQECYRDKDLCIRNITKTINNYLHFFVIDDNLKKLAPNYIFNETKKTQSSASFTAINKDLIGYLLEN